MTEFIELLSQAENDRTDRTVFCKLRSEFSSQFRSFFLQSGFAQARAGELIPRDDKTVLFTGSTISTFKPILLSGSIPQNGFFMIQDCLRTQNAQRMHDDSFHPKWSSMFLSTGTLSQYRDVEKASGIFWGFLTVGLGLNPDSIRIHISTLDKDLIAPWKNLGLENQLVFDTKDPVYYTHKFGIDGVVGRNCNVAIKATSSGEFRDIGNIIVIESNGQALGMEMAFGVETAVSRMLGLPTPIHAAPIAEFLPTNTNEELKIADAVAASTFILRSGIKPIADGRGRVLRSYLQGIAELLPRTALSPCNLEIASKQVEKACFETAHNNVGAFIASYVCAYQSLKEQMGPDRAALNKKLTKLALDFV